MAEPLAFYTNPMSRGRIARWMLEETGVEYDTHYLSYGDTMKSAAYLAINPMGKVPTIRHNGKTVTECAAICAYLADAFPEAKLAPATDDRADYYRWLFFAAGPLESATTNKAMGWAPSDEQKAMAGYGSFELAYDTLLGALIGKTYVCGDSFTAADVYVGSQVAWGLQFGTLPEHAVLTEYRDRVTARSAYIRASELDDAAMETHGPTPPG
ncbi:MAG: glutathione S-transferase family protein [Pseudomonadota bacterium]